MDNVSAVRVKVQEYLDESGNALTMLRELKTLKDDSLVIDFITKITDSPVAAYNVLVNDDNLAIIRASDVTKGQAKRMWNLLQEVAQSGRLVSKDEDDAVWVSKSYKNGKAMKGSKVPPKLVKNSYSALAEKEDEYSSWEEMKY